MPDPVPPPYGTRPEGGDLLVPPGSHAYVQKVNTSEITVFVGPKTVTFSGQERPVSFDDMSESFSNCERGESLRKNVNARQGEYVILENPAVDKSEGKPRGSLSMPSSTSSMSSTPELSMGKRVVIRGPVDFALWPRQKATVVQGHHLRSNQYLEATVYDPESAKENWNSGSIVVATPSGDKTETTPANKVATAGAPASLVVGQRLIIKGTEISFYIPPTGIEVVEKEDMGDDDNGTTDSFIRDAVTLERLEYCILVEENGRKRYEIGPQVVFPAPTEHFIKSSDGKRKFRAIELPQKAGIHIKVIADYEEGEKKFVIGEELFITGDTQSIYYPREEHSIISYGEGSKIHYGVAIPKGEGRYVMNRLDGNIRVEMGPKVLLCDPRTDVVVRRILTDKQCDDWYPNNVEVLNYNQSLRQIQSVAGTSNSRSDVVEERMLSSRAIYGNAPSGFSGYEAPVGSASYGSLKGFVPSAASLERPSKEIAGEEFRRGTSYTPPRAITLNTKFDGVPTIEIWSGYAVQVVSRTGERRVEMGPKAVLLSYDETLEQMFLSTGKPKTTDKFMRTVYLRTQNNKVSDLIEVETNDHVRCDIKLSFAVNFEEESKDLWFSCENYVKLLCDHVRSILKGEIKKQNIEDFYKNATQVIRDTILGAKKPDPANPAKGSRAGMLFAENGMRVTDVEVLAVEIKDQGIANLLGDSQRKVVQTNIDMATRQRELLVVQQTEDIERKKMNAKAETAAAMAGIEQDKIKLVLETAIQQHEANLQKIQADLKLAEERRSGEQEQFNFKLETSKAEADQELSIKKAQSEQDLETKKSQAELQIASLKAETEAVVAKFKACEGNFTETLALLCREENATKIATAASWQSVIGKKPLGDVLSDMFGKDSPIAAAIAGTMQGKGMLAALSSDGSRERSAAR